MVVLSILVCGDLVVIVVIMVAVLMVMVMVAMMMKKMTPRAKPSRIPKGVANKERESNPRCWGATTHELTTRQAATRQEVP